MTGSELDLSKRFYAALEGRDVSEIIALLHPEFEGHVTDGLPAGLGGTYHGPEAMLRDCWARAAQVFRAMPQPERFYAANEPGAVIVRGRYEFDSEASQPASFAHFLHFRDGRLAELWQVTDSRRWEPLDAVSNVDVVRRLFQAVEERDLETMFELYDPEVLIRESPSLPYGGEYRGHDGVVAHGLAYLGTWSPVQGPGDETLEAEFLDAGDHVYVHWSQKATASGGEHREWPALSEYRLRDGKIVASAMHHSDTPAILGFLTRAGSG